jgi:serine protease Do
MANPTLTSMSNELAGLAAAGAAHVVQVHSRFESPAAHRGRGARSISGVVHGHDTIVTMVGAVGREDGLRVAVAGTPDATIDADLAGWDPASGIAVLRTRSALDVTPPAIASGEPRPGEIVLALARSWSNAPTASAGMVAVVGGPLRTGRRREIARVIRITARMHDGFAGAAVLDTEGRLVGIATAAQIRGFAVVIPAAIAWAAASQVLTGGVPRRGFIGVAVQPVELGAAARQAGHERGLLVLAVTSGGPADRAGLIVGDVLLELDGTATRSPDDLLDLLRDRPKGRQVSARILRGGEARDVRIEVGDRQPA